METKDCKIGKSCAYFEGEISVSFRKLYNGVVVNGDTRNGYGHFAIRKPDGDVLLKNSREKMSTLIFKDDDKSIEVAGDINNQSKRKLIFQENEYEELKDNIPLFMKSWGYNFNTKYDASGMTMNF